MNTSTSPKVQYTYADGSANTVRPTGLVAPNGTAFPTAYESIQAGFLSRPDAVKESTTTIASMRFLGLGTLVGLNYDAASDVNLTYENGGTGDAGDKYTGLDRFGRLVETIWIKGGSDMVQSVYGRNRSSGIDWRRDDEASSTKAMDDYYEYDGLQQVTEWKRGNLSPGSGPPYTGVTSKKQGDDFVYDETGNWKGDISDNPDFNQTREHNVANQITSITKPLGVVQPVYDAQGNMTTSPKPGSWSKAYIYKWDAWNRLVEIKQGGTIVANYCYDALTRRVTKTISSTVRAFYFDRQWRSIEEREASTVKVQHLWSPLDRWTLIRRQRNASGSTLNETLFCLRDYLDPVALVDSSGVVQERYNYEAFGMVQFRSGSYVKRGSSNFDWDFLFHGEFIDEESGLYNYGYRYYDPQLGRWPSRDPIGEEGGMNLYAFVGNSGIGWGDLLGLEKCCCCAESLKFEYIGKATTEKSRDGSDVVSEDIKLIPEMSYKDTGEKKLCDLEWWEWDNAITNLKKKAGIEGSEWTRHYPEGPVPFPGVFDKWSRRECGTPSSRVDDSPRTYKNQRTLVITAKLTSGEGCDCEKQVVFATFYQYLDFDKDGKSTAVYSNTGSESRGTPPPFDLKQSLQIMCTFPFGAISGI